MSASHSLIDALGETSNMHYMLYTWLLVRCFCVMTYNVSQCVDAYDLLEIVYRDMREIMVWFMYDRYMHIVHYRLCESGVIFYVRDRENSTLD
jgi:hypothetical protein